MFSADDQVWISIVTAVTIFIAGFLLSWANDWRRDRILRSKAIESMIAELEDLAKFENERVKPIVEMIGTIVSYNGVQLQIASFDSMIFSLVFRDLDTETQVKISNHYEEVKTTNIMGIKILDKLILGSNDPNYNKNMLDLGKSMEERLSKNKNAAQDLIKHLKGIKPRSLISPHPIEE